MLRLSRWLLLPLALIATVAARHPRPAINHGPPLSGDEVRSLLVGKTAMEGSPAALSRGDKNNITDIYLLDNGTGYMYSQGGPQVWRGRWTINGDQLCLPGAYWPCAEFHSDGGKLYKHYLTGDRWLALSVVDGDPDGIVKRIESMPPYGPAAK